MLFKERLTTSKQNTSERKGGQLLSSEVCFKLQTFIMVMIFVKLTPLSELREMEDTFGEINTSVADNFDEDNNSSDGDHNSSEG